MGKLLRVNLTTGDISTEEIDASIAKDFIGALGVGTKYLYDEVDPKVEPLSPDNKLIFATGPLTGTKAPAGTRYMVVTKAPLTGAVANSNAGGYFPPELRFAGYDLIIFEGKSTIPVYLWINDDKVEIRNAERLWGKGVYETTDLILGETDKKARVACIGPAGENLVLFACIMNDKGRAAGRCGVGAVMGSKNLKAVAVRGTKRPPIFDKPGFEKLVSEYRKIFHSPARIEDTGFLSELGNPGSVAISSGGGVMPVRNFQSTVFEGVDKIRGETYADTISTMGRKGKACLGCPLGCTRVTGVTEPEEFAYDKGEGPEYETIGAFGPACDIDNLPAIAKANYICNDLGIDTITCGMTMACAMELFERGFLPEKDVGYKLNFGNARAMVELVRKIGYRGGFGNVLADGSYRLAQKYGHPEFFMGAKKLEFAAYEPRGMQGHALAYATCNRGGCHIRGEVGDVEVFGINVQMYGFKDKADVEPESVKGKPKLCKAVQDFFSVIDSTGVCNFILISQVSYEMLAAFLATATGFNYTTSSMLKAGERIFNIQRIFNLEAGFTAKDDTLPKRMLEEPLTDGKYKGRVVELDKMLPEYYQLRGWDERGVPTQKKLEELGLSMRE